MRIGELLYRVGEHGVMLWCGRTEDRLLYSPAGTLPAELLAELKKNKAEIIRMMREDEELRRTGLIQSERQVFDRARDYFRGDGVA
jgi:hypothetical protein